ncbi:MAG: sulfurtransferase TusA family protein [Dehalococcoidales bacterium]|nr:sulfurtransferase TusA family protein [Dehalococcoidales bacterium]MDP7524905.1 sulfurtransferase TusA family protein [Dehalococcoidales bacterium]|tara:strand:+ start:472 stop:690 length:219 start_codon:yes stop_codon:yes gene_type:complete
MENTLDLSGFVCPLSKMKAAEAVDNMAEGDTLIIILGESESFKSVAQDLKTNDIVPTFKQESESRYILTVSR